MANFLRLIFLIFSFISIPAFADFPPENVYPPNNCNAQAVPFSVVPGGGGLINKGWSCASNGLCSWKWENSTNGSTGSYAACWLPNPTLSCSAGAQLSGGSCVCLAGLEQVGNSCQVPCSAGEVRENGICKPKGCPAGQHEEGGACVPDKCKPEETRVNGLCVPEPPCPDGQTRVNGKCEANKCPKSGTFAAEYKVSSRTPTSFCENKCTISIRNFVEAIKDGQVVSRVGMGYHTGNSCNTDTPPGETTGGGGDNDDGGGNNDNGGGNNDNGGGNNDNGGGGGDNGGGNNAGGGGNNGGGGGGGGGAGGEKPPEKCTEPGGCTGTDGGTNNGGDAGASSGTSPEGGVAEGSCPDGKYKSGGKCYDIDQPEQDPDDDGACLKGYVKVNDKCVPLKPPEDEKDDKKGTFGGACGGGFSCEGDAIQCSIAKEQHIRNCKLFDEKSEESDLYNKEKNKQGDVTKDLPGNESISVLGRIDTSDALGGGGGGVSDLNLTVAGSSVTLPLSILNDPLRALGSILLAISFLIALRIIGRG